MGEWAAIPLAGLCDDVQYGVTASALTDLSNGPLLLRITDIVPPRIDWGAVLACDVAEEKVGKFELRDGDIVVARTGATVGYAKHVKRPPARAVFASYLVRFRVGDGADPAYIGHVVQSAAYKDYVAAHAGGAAQPNANAKVLGGFPVPLPDKRTQRRIAAVLSAFDELIEINERRIELLEDLARSLYREWFVHFRFPGHEDAELVDSELGPIPEGWEVATLDAVATVTMGQSPKSEFYSHLGEGLPFHQGVAGFGPLLPTHDKFCIVEARTAESLDVLCSVRAPVGRLNLADQRLVIGRGLSAIRRTDGYQAFLLLQLRQALGQEDSIGGGTIYKAIGRDELAKLAVLEPLVSCVARFQAFAGPALDERLELTLLNRQLAATRDLLLPRLVTGRLDISHIDLGVLTPSEAQ